MALSLDLSVSLTGLICGWPLCWLVQLMGKQWHKRAKDLSLWENYKNTFLVGSTTNISKMPSQDPRKRWRRLKLRLAGEKNYKF